MVILCHNNNDYANKIDLTPILQKAGWQVVGQVGSHVGYIYK